MFPSFDAGTGLVDCASPFGDTCSPKVHDRVRHRARYGRAMENPKCSSSTRRRERGSRTMHQRVSKQGWLDQSHTERVIPKTRWQPPSSGTQLDWTGTLSKLLRTASSSMMEPCAATVLYICLDMLPRTHTHAWSKDHG